MTSVIYRDMRICAAFPVSYFALAFRRMNERAIKLRIKIITPFGRYIYLAKEQGSLMREYAQLTNRRESARGPIQK